MRRFRYLAFSPLFIVSLFCMVGCNSSTPPDVARSESDSEADSAPDTSAVSASQTEADRDASPGDAATEVDATPLTPLENITPPAEPPVVASLSIGDPAPTLAIGKWMKGDAVDSFQTGRVYVVEFWATWCGPCRVSMPHMSQLQDEYGDQVTFVGISDEQEGVVQGFFRDEQNKETGATWNDVITYTIALDDTNTATSTAYMRAAKQSGIPTAFVVGKDGIIEWIGHPMSMDEPLAKIVADEWDRADAVAKFRMKQQASELATKLRTAMRNARETDDWSEIKEILADAEDSGLPARVLNGAKFDVAILSSSFDDAHAAADELAKTSWDDAQRLNSIAWNLTTRIPTESQNHDVALRIAQRAVELTESADGSVLDTVARIYYESGDLNEAVAWQRRAVEHATEGQSGLADTLKKYEDELAAE